MPWACKNLRALINWSKMKLTSFSHDCEFNLVEVARWALYEDNVSTCIRGKTETKTEKKRNCQMNSFGYESE